MSFSAVALILLILLTAYSFGAANTSYYLVKLFKKTDIRDYFSGNAGANNVRRLLGNKWFLIISLIDITKGALLVLLVNHFYPALLMPSLLATILGHCYPAQLNFRGGRGAAILIGSTIALSPYLALGLTCIFIILYIISSKYRFATLFTFSLLPLGAIPFLHTFTNILTLAIIIIVITHNYLYIKKEPHQ